MPKRHLFVMDPVDKINPSTDSTYDLMLECQERGEEIWACHIEELFVLNGKGHAIARQISIEGVSVNTNRVSYIVKSSDKKPFDDFQLIWMRKDPPVDENFIAALHILRCHTKEKTRLINNPDGLLVANEKLWALSISNGFMPQTCVSSSPELLYATAKSLGKVVVKPLFQAGGAGVMAFSADDRNMKSAIDLLTNQGKSPAMLQGYIDGAELGDKRIILVGGKPVGAMLRVPSKEDHRANLHVGGKAVKTDITERELEICKGLEPYLLQNGLYFVGIDVINGYLTEVNVTSPTGLQEIDHLNQNNGKSRLRARILDWVEENLN